MEDKEANNPHGQVVYTPLLDPNRDEKLLKVLPDYLTEEIMFAREQGIEPPRNRLNFSEHVLLASKPISSEKNLK
jgi:Chromosome segregation protein Csm1/Pcs1